MMQGIHFEIAGYLRHIPGTGTENSESQFNPIGQYMPMYQKVALLPTMNQ